MMTQLFVQSVFFNNRNRMSIGDDVHIGILDIVSVYEKTRRFFATGLLWSQQGMILRPPDYESGATNQLSYGTVVFVSFERLPRWTSIIQILTTERLLRFEFLVRLASISKYSKNLTAS